METLGDDLVLLSLDPGNGRIRTIQKIGYGLMGAELVRLAAAGRVDIEAGRVTVRNAAPTGDPRLDAALASLTESGRPPKAERWVGRPRRKILDAYLEHLAATGCLRREGRVLTRWRIGDAARVADARARLDAIAMSPSRISLVHAAFGGLAHAIGLENVLYPGWGNRKIRRRFREIADGLWTEPFAPEVPSDKAAADAAAAAGADAALAAGADAAGHHHAAHAAADAATHAATQAAADAATQAAMHAATQAAAHAATQAATDAATQAATHAATHAAVHAATHAAVSAAVQASVDAGHSAAASGGHGGH